jgi:GH15 family glucan-1,4-alpha-glucosidase
VFSAFDSPSVFGRLLDDTAGHWSIRPAGKYKAVRRYLARTLVLETTFRTPGGTLVVTDALEMGAGNRGHTLGERAPHLLIRLIACVAGAVDVEMSYAPRPEYGLLRPLLSHVDGGVTARGGAEWLVLSSPEPMVFQGSTATAWVPMSAGETVAFALHRSTLEEQPARIGRQDEIANRLADTVAAWQSLSQLHQDYNGPWRDLVQASILAYRRCRAVDRYPSTARPTTAPKAIVAAGSKLDMPARVGSIRRSRPRRTRCPAKERCPGLA